MSSAVTTLTLLATSSSGVGMRVAVTTMVRSASASDARSRPVSDKAGKAAYVNSAALPSARRAVRPVVMGKAPEVAHTRADGSWLQKLASARQARRTAGPASPAATPIGSRKAGLRAFEQELAGSGGSPSRAPQGAQRSEERRVGKECRSRWSPYH